MENFTCSTRIVSGSGSAAYLETMNIRRLLMVADPYFVQNEQARRIAALAKPEQTEYFTDIRPDPTVEQVAKGTSLCRDFRPDTVVALGGGSTLDCAKAMVHFSGLSVRFVAIPTTSGSGSEVTDFAVLTHGEGKHPLVDEKLYPQVAILDSDLLKNMPQGLIADTGFDALSHAAEALVATGAGAFTDALAKTAFGTVFTHLPGSFSGDLTRRQSVHEAATMAGMAFSQSGLGLCHAMSHALGGVFHLPHGRLNAILLPAVIRLNGRKCQPKYADLARFSGLGGSADVIAVRNLLSGLQRLRRELNMPDTLRQAGVDPVALQQKMPHILSLVLADPCCKTNPLLVEESMVRQILGEVTGRG